MVNPSSFSQFLSGVGLGASAVYQNIKKGSITKLAMDKDKLIICN
ncbi:MULTISPECIES: hypothetical protein [unclassified Gilliamella]|nr:MULTISPECIES: hypothetical protein [unclassified Gilliamella]